MSKKVLTREEVKKHITSLLVSAGCSSGTFGKTLTVRQLEDDFQMFIGCHLPVRQLGYTNIEEFLRDMSDVVQLLSVRGELHVQGVSSKSTAHIEKLISSQRSAPKRGAASKPKGPPPRKFHPPRSGPPRYGNNAPRGPPVRRYPQPQNRPMPPAPTIPAMVRGMVKDLLLSYPNGICVGPNFMQAFKRRYDEELVPQKFGCATLEQALNCMDDILEIQVQPNGEVKVKTKSLKPKLGSGRQLNGSAVVKGTRETSKELPCRVGLARWKQTLGNPPVLGPRLVKTVEDQWKLLLCWSSCPVKKKSVGSPSMGILMLETNEVLQKF